MQGPFFFTIKHQLFMVGGQSPQAGIPDFYHEHSLFILYINNCFCNMSILKFFFGGALDDKKRACAMSMIFWVGAWNV